jgi:hypothetical protein
MAFVMCVTPSCSDIKNNIRNQIEGEIKSLSVKPYKVNGTFYNFLPIYSLQDTIISMEERLIEMGTSSIVRLEDDIKFWEERMQLSNDKEYYKTRIEECRIEIEDWNGRIKEVTSTISDCHNTKETIKQTYNNGKLYIARYIKQTPNGIFETTYTYNIFLFDEDKEFVEYNGRDFYTLVKTKFPKATKDMLENL